MNDVLIKIIEAALFAYEHPLTIKQLQALFDKDAKPSSSDITINLSALQNKYQDSGIELVEVASGWRFQVRSELSNWINKLWAEKPQKYSKAFLETLALIAYRQPITRSEIESIRGVAVSSSIIKTMLEREWIKILGQKEVPGRPSLYGTSQQFLDYFNLQSLTDLPALPDKKTLGFADESTQTIQ